MIFPNMLVNVAITAAGLALFAIFMACEKPNIAAAIIFVTAILASGVYNV